MAVQCATELDAKQFSSSVYKETPLEIGLPNAGSRDNLNPCFFLSFA